MPADPATAGLEASAGRAGARCSLRTSRRTGDAGRTLWFAFHGLNGAVAGGAAAWFLPFGPRERGPSPALLVAVLIFLGIAAAERMSWSASLLPLARMLRPAAGPCAGVALTQAILGMLGLQPVSAASAAAIVVAGTTAVAAGHLLDRGRSRPRRVVVVGSPHAARNIESAVRGARAGDRFTRVGRGDTLTAEPQPGPGPAAPLGRVGALRQVVAAHEVDVMVIGDDSVWGAVARELAAEVGRGTVSLVSVVEFHERALGEVTDDRVHLPWSGERPHQPAGSAVKRFLDLVLAATLLVAAAPVIGVLAVLVRRDGGPAFFVQERTGRFGRPFRMYKLRSMTHRPDDGPRWATRDDDRITEVGVFLRRTHLDELPQLYNVLRGDMSLVGPRPEQPAFVDQLSEILPSYPVRHLVRPGVTGWAQVRGGYAGSVRGSARKLRHDIYYIRHRSLAMDLMIIVETVRTLFADRQFDDLPETDIGPETGECRAAAPR
ncbi:MAG: exopolysaccharide biosynthesis polyprenyl glycosylphosphotransferase [Thermoleophilia bacterium]|nr:exopolysaccharide biosynthesis polyprenyl glycosylphosphotransferase [Thermoleophilia bacterium]